MAPQPYIIEALRELGVQIPADFEVIQRAPSFEQAQQSLADLKERVRKNFKRLAFELHPDRTGGDSARTEHFKRLVQAKDELDKIQVHPMPRPQPTMVVSWVNQPRHPGSVPTTGNSVYTAYYASGANTTTSSTVGFSPIRVVTMRPL